MVSAAGWAPGSPEAGDEITHRRPPQLRAGLLATSFLIGVPVYAQHTPISTVVQRERHPYHHWAQFRLRLQSEQFRRNR